MTAITLLSDDVTEFELFTFQLMACGDSFPFVGPPSGVTGFLIYVSDFGSTERVAVAIFILLTMGGLS